MREVRKGQSAPQERQTRPKLQAKACCASFSFQPSPPSSLNIILCSPLGQQLCLRPDSRPSSALPGQQCLLCHSEGSHSTSTC